MSNVLASNFTPQFLYSSLSNLIISKNSFLDSFKTGDHFEVGAIQLSNNVTFNISDNIFRSLKNSLNGPVKNE